MQCGEITAEPLRFQCTFEHGSYRSTTATEGRRYVSWVCRSKLPRLSIWKNFVRFASLGLSQPLEPLAGNPQPSVALNWVSRLLCAFASIFKVRLVSLGIDCHSFARRKARHEAGQIANINFKMQCEKITADHAGFSALLNTARTVTLRALREGARDWGS